MGPRNSSTAAAHGARSAARGGCSLTAWEASSTVRIFRSGFCSRSDSSLTGRKPDSTLRSRGPLGLSWRAGDRDRQYYGACSDPPTVLADPHRSPLLRRHSCRTPAPTPPLLPPSPPPLLKSAPAPPPWAGGPLPDSPPPSPSPSGRAPGTHEPRGTFEPSARRADPGAPPCGKTGRREASRHKTAFRGRAKLAVRFEMLHRLQVGKLRAANDKCPHCIATGRCVRVCMTQHPLGSSWSHGRHRVVRRASRNRITMSCKHARGKGGSCSTSQWRATEPQAGGLQACVRGRSKEDAGALDAGGLEGGWMDLFDQPDRLTRPDVPLEQFATLRSAPASQKQTPAEPVSLVDFLGAQPQLHEGYTFCSRGLSHDNSPRGSGLLRGRACTARHL